MGKHKLFKKFTCTLLAVSMVCSGINYKAPTAFAEAAPEEVNLIENSTFDSKDGWTFSKGGVSGGHYYLDEGGYMYTVVEIPYTGIYHLTSSVNARNTGCIFGLKDSVNRNRIFTASGVSNNETWDDYATATRLQKGQLVEVFVDATKDTQQYHYVNGDDFSLTYSWEESLNEEFLYNNHIDAHGTDGLATIGDWEVNGGSIISYQGCKLDSENSTLSQNVRIPQDGPYVAQVAFISVEQAQISFGGKTVPVTSGGMVTLKTDTLTKDSIQTFKIKGKCQVAPQTSLKLDLERIQSASPEAQNVRIEGTGIYSGEYDFVCDGYKEKNSKYSWLISDTEDGEYEKISGAEAKSYLPTDDQKGKYLKFSVIPSNLYAAQGLEVESAPIQIVCSYIKNGGFEDRSEDLNDAEASWPYASVWTDDPYSGSRYALISTGKGLKQNITIPETGYYDLTAYVKYNGSCTPKMQLSGRNCAFQIEKEISGNEDYQKVEIKHIQLEKDNTVQLYFDASDVNDVALKLDNITLIREESETPINIRDMQTSETPVKKDINPCERQVNLKYVSGTDLSKIKLTDIEVTDGAKANIESGSIIDLTSPVIISLSDDSGNAMDWTLTATTTEADRIKVTSSNKTLENIFNWAVEKQRQFVMTGKTGIVDKYENNGHQYGDGTGNHEYMPSYWAGYYHRTAFYSRDFCHQATGGEISGLTEENYNMFHTFAKGCTEARNWWTLWAYNFDGSPMTIDYYNDYSFIKEIPAQFELVEKAYKQYLWSGDERYINDPDMFEFYTNVMTKYLACNDRNNNSVADSISGGTCTYNERGDSPIESGDTIGSQYQAELAYAGILSARGEQEEAEKWYQKAQNLKDFFNQVWSVNPNNEDSYYARAIDRNGNKSYSFALEGSWFMPYKMITESGEKNDEYIDFILDSIGNGVNDKPGSPKNVEALTYIPDMLFLYNRSDDAWKWMNYIYSVKDLPHEQKDQGNNGDYPEVSFTLASQVIEGIMGVEPNAGKAYIATAPRLPEDVEDVRVDNLSVGDFNLSLEHDNNTETTLVNNAENPITWEARFYGNYDYIRCGEENYKAEHKDINGEAVSYTVIPVKAGQTVTALATSSKPVSDKTDLQKLYDKWKNETKAYYTDATWDILTEALNETDTLLKSDDATQKQISEKLAELERAIDQLKTSYTAGSQLPANNDTNTTGTTEEENTVSSKPVSISKLVSRTEVTLKTDGFYYDKNDKILVNTIIKTKGNNKIFLNEEGKKCKSTIVTVSSKERYLVDEEGMVIRGSFVSYDNNTYYTSKTTGKTIIGKLFKVSGKKYYANKSGKIVKSKWVTVGKKKYLCDDEGVIVKTKNVK